MEVLKDTAAVQKNGLCYEDELETKVAILRVCSDGVCCSDSEKDKESRGGPSDATGKKREGGVSHEGEESEAVAPGNKRALSQDENEVRQ